MQLREVARELRLFKLLLGHMLSLLFGGNEFAPTESAKVKRGAKPRDGRAALPIGGYSSIFLPFPTEARKFDFCSENRPAWTR